MAGRAEAQHSASPSLVNEPRQQQASMKDGSLRSPVEDPAGPNTQENAVHQKQGQDVHSECGNKSSDGDGAIHAHYSDQVRAVPANMCKHIMCTVCALFGRCPTRAVVCWEFPLARCSPFSTSVIAHLFSVV